MYQIDQPEYETLALPPPPVTARVVYSIEGQEGESAQRRAYADPRHSRRRVVDAACGRAAVFGETSPSTQIIPAGPNPSAELSVVVRTTLDHASGTVSA